MPPNKDSSTRLLQLIKETCRLCDLYKSEELPEQKDEFEKQYQRSLNQLILLIQQSRKLYQARDLPPGDYEDALQKTWLYFCRNLCKGVTAKNSPYDAEKSNIFTWLNAYLKKRILDAHLANQEAKKMIVSPRLDEHGQEINLIDNIPSPELSRYNAIEMLERIQHCLNSQEHQFRRIHIRDRPEINAYVLILRRLPPEETTWETLAQEWHISRSTLANFYQRRCLPELQTERFQKCLHD